MAVISAALLALLVPGDHAIVQRGVYGGTYTLFMREFAALGITHTFVSGSDPAEWIAAARPNTKVFYCETLTNPLLEVADLPGIVGFARKRDLTTVVDATFTTPIAARPIEHGFDLVLHSATKYMNGHSDIVAGAIAGSSSLIERTGQKLVSFGGSLDPHACFLLHRGLRTMGVRVRHSSKSALEIARFLSEHPRVRAVRHPGLSGHPGHALARDLYSVLGAIVSFEVDGDADVAQRVIDRLELFADAPSLGGAESLVTRPSTTSHAGMDPDERRRIGIPDGLVRLAIGLEDPDDLIDDLRNALDAVAR